MIEELRKLRERYANARTEREKKAIDAEMTRLSESDPDAFAEGMIALVRDSNERAEALNIRRQLEDVLPAVSVAYIARHYFGKTRQWLYQRLNGSVVNGKPAQFTPQELKTLEAALHDIGKKLTFIHVSP